jgi:hypothetical protein
MWIRISLETGTQRCVRDLRPGKPTTDSGGKSSELTSAIQSKHQPSTFSAIPTNLLPAGGYTSALLAPAFPAAETVVVGAAPAPARRASSAPLRAVFAVMCILAIAEAQVPKGIYQGKEAPTSLDAQQCGSTKGPFYSH